MSGATENEKIQAARRTIPVAVDGILPAVMSDVVSTISIRADSKTSLKSIDKPSLFTSLTNYQKEFSVQNTTHLRCRVNFKCNGEITKTIIDAKKEKVLPMDGARVQLSIFGYIPEMGEWKLLPNFENYPISRLQKVRILGRHLKQCYDELFFSPSVSLNIKDHDQVPTTKASTPRDPNLPEIGSDSSLPLFSNMSKGYAIPFSPSEADAIRQVFQRLSNRGDFDIIINIILEFAGSFDTVLSRTSEIMLAECSNDCKEACIQFSEPPWCVVKCHCGTCREYGNGAPMLWAGFNAEDIEFGFKSHLKFKQIGSRWYCKSCLQPMYMEYEDGYIYINAAKIRGSEFGCFGDMQLRQIAELNKQGNTDIVVAHIWAVYDSTGKKGTNSPFPARYKEMFTKPALYFGPYPQNIDYQPHYELMQNANLSPMLSYCDQANDITSSTSRKCIELKKY